MRENPPLEQERDLAGSGSGVCPIAALVDALRPLDDRKAGVLHAAAHRLRTPLTSIVGFLELLREGAAGPVTPEQERALRTIARNSAQLSALVDELEAGVPGTTTAPAVSPATEEPTEEFRRRG